MTSPFEILKPMFFACSVLGVPASMGIVTYGYVVRDWQGMGWGAMSSLVCLFTAIGIIAYNEYKNPYQGGDLE
jgi:hypothetical protein